MSPLVASGPVMHARRGGGMRGLAAANLLALLLPLALLAGAWGSQLIGGLYPCEMCHWQRWPHYAAVALAGLAYFSGRPRPLLVSLAALAIAVSGAIGVFHAGVEYGWWQGITGCSGALDLGGLSPAERLDAIMGAPLIRCDRPAWTLAGVSLAGFNALFSLGGAVAILALMRRR